MKTLVIGVVVLFIAATAATVALSAQYGPYGAIAYSKSTGQWAWGTGYSTNEAEAKARSLCGRSDCIVYTSTHRSCAGLARSLDRRYFAWSWGQSNHGRAEIRAMNRCEESGKTCKIVYAGCTLR